MLVFNLNHLLHYVLLGAVPAALGALLSTLRTGTAIVTNTRWVAVFFIALTLVAGWFVVDAWVDMLPLIGTIIGTYSIFCLSGIKMRVGFLLGAICWLANNLIVGSIGGTLLEATIIATNSATIYRLNRCSDSVAAHS